MNVLDRVRVTTAWMLMSMGVSVAYAGVSVDMGVEVPATPANQQPHCE
jgi:hypothetical protein